MKKRGQAGMEFLMNYGWMILVVLTAIGALAYFGVLNPSRFLPNSCTMAPGIGCEDFKIQQDAVTMVLRNGAGELITISNLSIEDCIESTTGTIEDGGVGTFMVGGCSNTVDSRFDKEVYMTYTKGNRVISHAMVGQVVGKVEEGTVILHFNDDFSVGIPDRYFGYDGSNPLPPDSYTGWTVQDGSWDFRDGNIVNYWGRDIITLNLPYSQVGKAIRSKILEGWAWRYPRLYLAWQDSSNYYLLQSSIEASSSDGKLTITKVVNGSSTTLSQSTSIDLDQSVWYWMEFRWVSPTTLEGQVWDIDWNSLLTIQATISEGWTSGNYGLGCYRGGQNVYNGSTYSTGPCYFDNIQIHTIT